jgi:hypothetical protein
VSAVVFVVVVVVVVLDVVLEEVELELELELEKSGAGVLRYEGAEDELELEDELLLDEVDEDELLEEGIATSAGATL